jgi:glycosyltransferase involved in cell wall biosynthesis
VIENRNIVCLASNWHIDPTSKHQVMKLLSQRNNVLWVNYHASRRPQASVQDLRAIARKLGQIAGGIEEITPTLRVLTPMLVPLPGFPGVRTVNRTLLLRQLRRAMTALPRRPVQVWSFAPDAGYLVGRLREECFLYYCVDEFSEFEGYDRQRTLQLERELMRAASIVITTSASLQASKSPFNPRTHLVTHGVDYDHFARATLPDTTVPDDIRGIPKPIFGFYGLIQHWVDVAMVAEVARRRPAWSFVMIGEALKDVGPYRHLPNLHFLGRKPYASLPGYAKAFDLGLIPFELNELTRNVNPIKLREYLSAGLPVVSTPLPEVVRYGDYVYLASNADEFESACARAIGEDNPERRAARQAAMTRETWVAKVEELSALVARACG